MQGVRGSSPLSSTLERPQSIRPVLYRGLALRVKPPGAAMTDQNVEQPAWQLVDEGWGRKAVDFASLSEPGNCREYVAVHHLLNVDHGDRLLDVACGAGLAIELAGLRGATCA